MKFLKFSIALLLLIATITTAYIFGQHSGGMHMTGMSDMSTNSMSADMADSGAPQALAAGLLQS